MRNNNFHFSINDGIKNDVEIIEVYYFIIQNSKYWW